jgi:hypothetical protein
LNIGSPRLVKIDVEGMELSVLNGMKKTLDRAKPYLFIEFIRDRKPLMEFLDSVDYEWRLVESPLFNPDNFNGVQENVLKHPQSGLDLVSGDIVCWHKSMKLEVEDSYFVDLDSSDNPRHVELREIRDGLFRSGDFAEVS